MYQHLFGPVPSRRLGMSLGIDLVPHKVCSLNCVYCECGRTTNLTTDRKEYVSYDEVTGELEHFLKNHPAPDWLTFSGAGEPTLNSRIGEVITFAKDRFPDLRIAVLTNGTLLSDPEVRKEIRNADLVLPSLDAASETVFRKMDRPWHGIRLDEYIQGLVDLKKGFKGEFWLEVMILPGYNDAPDELQRMKEAITRIRPDRVQLNTLDRPGTVDQLRAANRMELQHIIDFWQLPDVEIIASVQKRTSLTSYREDTETAILETITRRPCTLEDLEKIVGLHVNEINKYLGVLDQQGLIEAVRQERGLFYQVRH